MKAEGSQGASVLNVERRGPITLIELNRPRSSNAIDPSLANELQRAANHCLHESELRAVVLTGAGAHFCVGGDLRAIAAEQNAEAYVRRMTQALHAAISILVRLDVLVIVAATGHVAGAGVSLCAMADLAICGEGTLFSLAYTRVGLTPDGGASFLLSRIVGTRRTSELLLRNRTLSARQALEWGLVNEVEPDSDVRAVAFALAHELSGGPRSAFSKTKRLLASSLGAFESQLSLESNCIGSQVASPEAAEGIRAFLEKRSPEFV